MRWRRSSAAGSGVWWWVRVSGWCSRSNRRKALAMSAWDADEERPSTRYGSHAVAITSPLSCDAQEKGGSGRSGCRNHQDGAGPNRRKVRPRFS